MDAAAAATAAATPPVEAGERRRQDVLLQRQGQRDLGRRHRRRRQDTVSDVGPETSQLVPLITHVEASSWQGFITQLQSTVVSNDMQDPQESQLQDDEEEQGHFDVAADIGPRGDGVAPTSPSRRTLASSLPHQRTLSPDSCSIRRVR
ncbi:unnamed protein product, partial [Meganyctiphanes norvegica]